MNNGVNLPAENTNRKCGIDHWISDIDKEEKRGGNTNKQTLGLMQDGGGGGGGGGVM